MSPVLSRDVCGTWPCRREAQQPEGPLVKYTHFVGEEVDGRRGPATEPSGTGTFAFLFQPRAGSPTSGPLTLSDWLSAVLGCSEEGVLLLRLRARQTPGVGDDLESLGWGGGMRRMKGSG